MPNIADGDIKSDINESECIEHFLGVSRTLLDQMLAMKEVRLQFSGELIWEKASAQQA